MRRLRGNMTEKLKKIACDICKYKKVCELPGEPIDSCVAYQFVKRAWELGYIKI